MPYKYLLNEWMAELLVFPGVLFQNFSIVLKQTWQNLATLCPSLGGGNIDASYFSIFFISLQRKKKKKVNVNSNTQSRKKNQQTLKS